MNTKINPVSVVMGSESDRDMMKHATVILQHLDIGHDLSVVSAHRDPFGMLEYAKNAHKYGVKVIIAGAGGAAHLPGMIASATDLPVIGVPIPSTILHGMDSLLSIVQMPSRVPVATMAIGIPGAQNAAILAARILALNDNELLNRLKAYIKRIF